MVETFCCCCCGCGFCCLKKIIGGGVVGWGGGVFFSFSPMASFLLISGVCFFKCFLKFATIKALAQRVIRLSNDLGFTNR